MKRPAAIALTAALFACPLLLPACGKGSSPVALPTPGSVVTEPARAVTQTVGPEGGVLTTTAGDGTEYTLEVPSGVLAQPVAITMTPVVSMRDQPLTGTVAGAVDLQPSGLVFSRAALLRVKRTLTPGPGERLVGFSAPSDADSFFVAALGRGTGEFGVFVQHFSIAGFGTTASLESFTQAPTGSMDAAFARIIALALPADRAVAIGIARETFLQTLLPAIQAASGDGALLRVLADYDAWRTMIDFIDLGDIPIVPLAPGSPPPPHRSIPELASEIAQANEELAFEIKLAIEGNNDECDRNSSLIALSNVFFWQQQAEFIGVATGVHGLDMATVLAGLCARVELVSQTLPPALQVGFPHSLDMVFGVRFDNGTLRAAPFEVSLTATNITLQHPSGATDASGFYTTVATAQSNGPIEIRAQACLILPGRTRPSSVCAEFNITGSSVDPPIGVDISGQYAFGMAGVNAIGQTHCGSINGATGTMTLTQSGNGVSGRWNTNNMCGIGITMAGTLSGTLSSIDGQLFILGLTVEVTSASRSDGPTDLCVIRWSPFRASEPHRVNVALPGVGFGGQVFNQRADPDCGPSAVGDVILSVGATRIGDAPAEPLP